MTVYRRTFIAGAVAALCAPAAAPALTVAQVRRIVDNMRRSAAPVEDGWYRISPAMWNGVGDPVVLSAQNDMNALMRAYIDRVRVSG